MCQVSKEKEKTTVELQVEIDKLEQSNPFWDFSNQPQKERKGIDSIKQTGANCGCFAGAMAIASLLGINASMSPQIAKAIEFIAEKSGISSIGELFDADALTAAINTFATVSAMLSNEKDKQEWNQALADKDIKIFALTQEKDISKKRVNTKSFEHKWDKKLMAKTVEFDSDDSLKKILKEAQIRGVKVLVSYYSVGGIPSIPGQVDLGSDNKVAPEKMSRAHWAAIDKYDESKSEITLKEGLEKNTTTSTTQLFSSNESLGGSISWNEYLINTKTLKAEKEAALKVRVDQGTDYTRIGNKPDPFISKDSLDTKNSVERVNLRGKLILIGYEKSTKDALQPNG